MQTPENGSDGKDGGTNRDVAQCSGPGSKTSNIGSRRTGEEATTVHTIEPSKETLHGVFSGDLPPVLAVEPGETVVFCTLDAGWGLEPPTGPGARRRRFEVVRPEWRGDGHALCGPVAVSGAELGMTLEVRIDEVRPGPWGWTHAGGPTRN